MRHSLPLLALLATTAVAQSYSVPGAKQLAAAGNWQELLTYTKAWTAAEPANANAWYYLASTRAIGLVDPAGAVADYEQAVKLNPEWAEAWNALGASDALAAQFAKAVPAFRHAVAADPHQPSYWINLEAALAHQGEIADAREALQRGVDSAGAYAKGFDWYVMGNAYAGLAVNARALQFYDKAVAIDPKLKEAWNNRAVIEQAEGEWTNALDDYHQAAGLGDEMAAKNAASLEAALAKTHPHGIAAKAASVVHKTHLNPEDVPAGAAHAEAPYGLSFPK